MEKVSVILLNYNNENHTKECLESLEKVKYPCFQVVVVNNGSTEESGKRLREVIKKVRETGRIGIKLVEIKVNRGFAGGCNVGVNASATELVALLNNDTTVDRNYLSEMVKELRGNVAIVGSRISNTGQFYGRAETLGNVLSITGDPVNIKARDSGFTFMAMGCSMLFSRKKIGIPFDEDYFMYGEDVYAAWLARLRGFDVRIAPDSKLSHLGGQVRKKTPDLAEFHGEKNKLMNLLLFYERQNLIKLLPVILANALMTLAVSAFKGRAHIRVRSYLWLIRNYRRIMQKRSLIQKARKVSDDELAEYMTCKIPYNFGILSKPINFALRAYCAIVGLPVREVRI